MSETSAPARNSLLWLVALVGSALVVGGAGGAFTSSAIPTWYAGLAKPPLTPPNWVFPIVWTTLYVFMGVAQWLVWRRGGFRAHPTAHLTYLLQLALNFLWSLIFFGLHEPKLALIEVVALLIAIGFTLRAFWRIDALAGWLLAPYLAWVAFATYLNIEIVILNP